MWRLACLTLAAVSLAFAAIADTIWTIGDTTINLFYLGLMFVVLAWIPVPIPTPHSQKR